MMIPDALAAAAIGAGGTPEVVLPSVNMTITLALGEAGSKSCTALANASAWFVDPPAFNPFTALLSAATEVIS